MPRVLALPRCCVQASRGTRISPAWDQGRLWRAGASTGGPSGFAEHWQVTRWKGNGSVLAVEHF